jgi:hypothetical protein
MYLINTPAATTFMQRMSIDTGRRAWLGDATKFHGSALNHIGFAHNAMIELVAKLTALADDPTRSEPERHDAARKVASKATNMLTQSQAGLEAAARELANEGNGIISGKLALDPNRQAVHSEIRGWIREQAGKPDGIINIREAAKTNSELVGVIYSSPDFLVGLSEETRGNIVLDGFKRFAPDGCTKLEQAQELRELAGKYPAIIQQVHYNSYNPAIADQAARRVEV